MFKHLLKYCALLTVAVCLTPAISQAQNSAADTVYQVRLTDGTKLVGRIESRTDDRVVLVTVTGARLELLAAQVATIAPATGRIVNGVHWAPDPNPSRMLFAPTGRSVGKGSGYLGVFFYALPFVAYGVTDRITLAGGAPILFGSLDFFYLAPKVELVRTSGLSVATGILSFFAPQHTDDLESIGIAYGVATLGNRDRALTGAVGFGYAGDDVAGQPAIMIGGETRVSPRIKLMTENYFVAGETGAIIAAGVRILGERLTGDIAMGGFVSGDEGGCCLPIVNLSYTIGKQR